MDRIDTATKAVDLHGAGKHGFKDGDLALGISPTDLDADWFNAVQEEIANVIEGAGIVLNGAVRTQLSQAINAISSSSKIQPITATVAANALTLGHAGNVAIDYRNAALASGAVSSIKGGALSLVVPSGATLGSVAATPFRVWLAKVLDAGVEYLAVMNTQIVSGSDITLAPVNEGNLISTTAIDAAADSAGVWYSAAAHANCPFRLVGYVEMTEAVAGTYATDPSTIQGMHAGLPKPGTVLQYVPAAPYTTYTASSTGIAYSDAVPTTANGVLLHSVSITPQSGVNILRSRLDGQFGTLNSGQACTVAMFSGATIKQAVGEYYLDSTGFGPISFSNSHQALTTAARTLTTRFGPNVTTAYVNGSASGRKYGGASSCTFYVEEIQS